MPTEYFLADFTPFCLQVRQCQLKVVTFTHWIVLMSAFYSRKLNLLQKSAKSQLILWNYVGIQYIKFLSGIIEVIENYTRIGSRSHESEYLWQINIKLFIRQTSVIILLFHFILRHKYAICNNNKLNRSYLRHFVETRIQVIQDSDQLLCRTSRGQCRKSLYVSK